MTLSPCPHLHRALSCAAGIQALDVRLLTDAKICERVSMEFVRNQPTACFDGEPIADVSGRALPGTEAVWAAVERESDRLATPEMEP